MRTISEIIVHCSATPEGRDNRAADIDRWHRQRGFRCIGYHYVIDLDGTIEAGRSPEEQGAHCVGHNAYSIGICYIGGCDKDMQAKDTRTDAQKASLRLLLRYLRQRYPAATIYGHHDFDKGKACPSFDAKKEYATI